VSRQRAQGSRANRQDETVVPDPFDSCRITSKPEVEKIGGRQSYNELAGRNKSRLCWEATRPRDHPVGSSRRGTEREGLASALFKNHIGSVDLDAWKIPARKAEYSLTGSAITPFQAEPTVVLVNSELIDRLGFGILPSVPFRPPLFGALRVFFCFVPEPCDTATGNPGAIRSAFCSAR
jgi:hypothetical protein